ncbi:MAG: hypothetical protein N2258_08465 [Brevinematales bacterium]|nr:hypothetical protein [Brevinematales bacterium]
MAEIKHTRKCSVCGKEEALVFFKIVKENQVEEKGFCARCALKYLETSSGNVDFSYVDDKMLASLNEVKNLIGYLINGIEAVTQNKDGLATVCPNCGISFKNFLESGYLGCQDCYSTFRKGIKDYIYEFERGVQHRGLMPKKYVELYLIKKEILYLSNKIKRLILSENFEEAIKVKKRLEKLIGTCPINYEDELY